MHLIYYRSPKISAILEEMGQLSLWDPRKSHSCRRTDRTQNKTVEGKQ